VPKQDGSSNLVGLSKEELKQQFVDIGLAPYRAQQCYKWIYSKGVSDFKHMTDLSKRDQAFLTERFVVDFGNVATDADSNDGTRKLLLDFPDKTAVETVFIPFQGSSDKYSRGTLCVSSQAGCSLSCTFCHTGTRKLQRNLKAGEIVSQVMTMRHLLGEFPLMPSQRRSVSNLVFMGEGEPLYNYRQVKKAIQLLTDPEGPAIGKRRITLSSSGIAPLIEKVGTELDVNLAISLHAPTNDLRSEIMAINNTYPLEVLMAACRKYSDSRLIAPDSDGASERGGDEWGAANGGGLQGRRRRVTWEYVMLAGVNDSMSEARELHSLLHGIPSLINLIPFNPWPGSPYEASSTRTVKVFAQALEDMGMYVTVRWPRGGDILAACGQLKGANEAESEKQ
jgi:23S rRNA (adenine2503-C2)-methyltransferase